MKHFAKYIGLSYDEVDCWEMAQRIYRQEYETLLPNLPLKVEERNKWKTVDYNAEEEGDLLVFRISTVKRHVGIVVADGRMIHSDEVNGVVVERYTGLIWKDRLQKIYRHV